MFQEMRCFKREDVAREDVSRERMFQGINVSRNQMYN